MNNKCKLSIEMYFSPLPKEAPLLLSWKPLEKYVTQQLKLGLPRVTHDWKLLIFKLIFAAELEGRIIRAPTVYQLTLELSIARSAIPLIINTYALVIYIKGCETLIIIIHKFV